MEEYKSKIEHEIVQTMIKGLREGKIQESQLPDIADAVLKGLKPVKDHNELIGFLGMLSLKYPIFTPLSTLEEGKLKRVIEKNTAKDVLKMISSNQIDGAIKLAQGATES